MYKNKSLKGLRGLLQMRKEEGEKRNKKREMENEKGEMRNEK